jgi:hypothetical protein
MPARLRRTEQACIYLKSFQEIPQYYRDENGAWWLVEYGTTTKESYDFQTKPKESLLNSLRSYSVEELVAFTRGKHHYHWLAGKLGGITFLIGRSADGNADGY